MVDRFERFSLAISELYRHWHRIAADEMEKYGLKGPYAVYFTAMSRYKDGITAARLSELCGRDKSDVSRAISTMERKGLVKKECVNRNLYRARLVLTEEGKQVADDINYRAMLAVEYGGQGLSKEKREILYDALETIVANLQILSEKGLPL